MAPSQPGPAPIAARNAGNTAVAVSWLQSLNRLVSPTPRTVRLSQDCFAADADMRKQFTGRGPQSKVPRAMSEGSDSRRRSLYQCAADSKAAARLPHSKQTTSSRGGRE